MALSAPLIVGPDCHGRRVAIVDGLIAAEPKAEPKVLSCAEGEIGVGNVCAHTHLYSGLARYGMPAANPAPENFLQILDRLWWRLDRALDADTLRASAMDYVARALLAGTTSLVDHHKSPNFIEGSLAILADACEQLGIRALLCYGATERNFGREEAERGLAECRDVPPSKTIRGLIGLHASFTVSDETIRDARELARKLDTVVHVHVAEDLADVEDAISRGYAGPFERMKQLGALPAGSILAHGVHLNRAQVEDADDSRCWLVQNPRSNEGNQVGYAQNLRYAKRVALGTDGWNGDMGEEEAALFRLAGSHGDDNASGRLAAGHALMAERFGAVAEPLASAALGDLVVRQDGQVRHVVVGGRIVVQDGRLTGGDMDEIIAVSQDQARKLWSRMAAVQ